MNVRESFDRVEIFAGISESTKEMLITGGCLEGFKRGTIIYADKDLTQNIYILIDGWASISKSSSNGEKKVIFVYGKGKSLNEELINGLPASSTCEAMEDVLVLAIPISKLIVAMEKDSKLVMQIMNAMSIKIRRLYRQMKNTSNSLRGDRKIAAKLWKLSMDYGSPCEEGTEIMMDFTITYFADMVGSTRETVSRQLKSLIDQNLVIYSKNKFIVPNREKLREFFNAP